MKVLQRESSVFNGETKRYGTLRGPTSISCKGLRLRLFCSSAKKNIAFNAVLGTFRPFLWSVVALIYIFLHFSSFFFAIKERLVSHNKCPKLTQGTIDAQCRLL